MVDTKVWQRAISGNGLIEGTEVESKPETLKDCAHFLLIPTLQEAAKNYFTEDAWLMIEDTLRVVQSNLDWLLEIAIVIALTEFT